MDGSFGKRRKGARHILLLLFSFVRCSGESHSALCARRTLRRRILLGAISLYRGGQALVVSFVVHVVYMPLQGDEIKNKNHNRHMGR
jgi:hypothetical protein